MPVKAGQIVIDVDAGTSKFVVDMEKAKAKIREFGEAGVSSHKAVAAEVKALEGNIFNNVRAADAFVASIKGIGPLVQAAFPVVGALAFAGVLIDLGKKVYDFFKGLRDQSELSKAAWNNVLQPMRLVNDELDLANAKLEQDIAKLEGKRQNNLAVALAEAAVQADKLGASLNKDLESINKLLNEQTSGFFNTFFAKSITGAFTGGLQGLVQSLAGSVEVDRIKKELGGDSGQGGLFGRQQSFENGTKDVHAYSALITEYQNVLNDIGGVLHGTAVTQAQRETLESVVRGLKAEMASIPKVIENVDLTKKKGQLEAGAANAGLTKPIDERLKDLRAQLTGLQELSKGIGGTEAEQVAARASEAYSKAIEELDKALGNHKNLLLAVDRIELDSYTTGIAQQTADNEAKKHYDDINDSIQERITGQRELADAIGQTYQATRNAFIATEIAKANKGHADDPAFLQKHADELAGLRSGFGAQFDAEHNVEAEKAILNLNQQIDLETSLAAAQSLGSEAVRRAELAQRILVIQRTNSVDVAKKLVAAEIALYEKQRANASAANITKLNQDVSDQSRIGRSAFGGAASLRKAQLQIELDAMKTAGATQAELAAKVADETVKHQTEINLEAGKTVTHYSDQLEKLNEIRASIVAQGGDAAALLTIDKERLEVMAQQDLATGTALGGLKAYFEKMQAEAKTTGQIVFDALNDATEKVSDELSKTLTGQKANYKKLFQGLAADLDKELIKSQLSKGIGALGKILHIDTGTQRTPSFRPGDPGHVIVDNLGGGGASGGGTAPSGGGFGGGTFGGGSQGGGIFSLLGQGAQAGLLLSHAAAGLAGLPGLAEGGDVNPYSTYVVGENAPELFTPRSAGTITPMHKMGEQSHYYSIDARGAALGVENRIARSIESAHSSAISHSMKAMQERQRRTPQRKGDR